MNDTVRNDPWRVVPRLQDEINHLFGNVSESDSSAATAAWIPAVDIHEYPDRSNCLLTSPESSRIRWSSRWRTAYLHFHIRKHKTAIEMSKMAFRPAVLKCFTRFCHFLFTSQSTVKTSMQPVRTAY
jgi:hypothetical protein